jgi:hypothetical protein
MDAIKSERPLCAFVFNISRLAVPANVDKLNTKAQRRKGTKRSSVNEAANLLPYLSDLIAPLLHLFLEN